MCPACRAPIALDDAVCGRCSLAVRPTCAVCAEALWVGVDACPGCGEAVENVAGPEVAEAAIAAEPLPLLPPHIEDARFVPRAPAPDEAWPAEGLANGRRRRQWLHVLAVGVASGVIVAGGLLALELVGSRSRLGDVALEERSFAQLGFAVSHPAGWTVASSRAGGLDAVEFTDPTQPSQRGFRVVVDDVPLGRVRDEVEELYRRRRADYRAIAMTDGRVGGRPAVRHVFLDSGLAYEQWWVERTGGTHRIELWSAEREAEDATVLYERIVRSFEAL